MSLIDARELIRMAKKDEDVGVVFYEALAEKVTDPKLGERFLEIRKQEETHSKRFQEMLDGLGDYVPREDSSGDYEGYYSAFLSKHEYMQDQDSVEKARNAASDVDAIKLALAQEKDTLLFFLEMKELIPSGQNREFVQAVIEEEREHITELSEMLQERI